jgi:hypothetical protein
MGKDESVKLAASPNQAPALRNGQDDAGVGPVFISGRQHSGNTMTAFVFGKVPDCCAAISEDLFFEYRARVEKMKNPARRAQYLVDLLRLEDAALADRTRDWLIRWQQEQSTVSAIDLYREAMRFITADSGKRFWVRKATSYIFYAEDMLTLMPDVRILYLLRNPYDISASRKRRFPKRERILGGVVSWNLGLRIGLKLREAYPDRFLIVRYEDMVTDPVATFRGIFDFVGVPFREEYLDVPHVNRSEAAYTRTSAARGLNPSRVYYYTDILGPTEVAALDMLVWKERLAEYYPDLPHRQDRRPLATRIKALGLVVSSPFSYAIHQVRQFFRYDTAWRLRRVLRRAWMVVR